MKIKKVISWLFLVLLVLVVAVVLGIHFFLDGAIKRGVETIGPRLTKVDVKLDSVSLSLLSGSGKIKNLVVGNPEGYKSPSAISLGEASLALEPKSLLGEKVIIHSINVQAPEITYDTDIKSSNLKKILANLEESTGGKTDQPAKADEPQETQKQAAKKLQVDDLTVTGGKIHVLVNALGVSQAVTVPLPTISLKNLGQGPDGITPAELSKQLLSVILTKASEEAVAAVADVAKGGTFLSKGINTSNTVDKAASAIGDFLKSKK